MFRAQKQWLWPFWSDIEWNGSAVEWPREYESREEAERIIDKYRRGALWPKWKSNEKTTAIFEESKNRS